MGFLHQKRLKFFNGIKGYARIMHQSKTLFFLDPFLLSRFSNLRRLSKFASLAPSHLRLHCCSQNTLKSPTECEMIVQHVKDLNFFLILLPFIEGSTIGKVFDFIIFLVRKHVVFGKVTKGMEIIKKIELLGKSDGKPSSVSESEADSDSSRSSAGGKRRKKRSTKKEVKQRKIKQKEKRQLPGKSSKRRS
ncbi:unnamed protein product [Lactuca saligna]|uniref:Uncharacterized protein n=1 Tax=Lactuca saligna TaxID=75948 RepID=A0AA35Z6J5_LACSI|nr:unnamed protein product [Lactuca saligna]